MHEASNYEIKLSRGLVRVRSGTYMVSSGGVLNVLEGLAIMVRANADGSMTTNKIGRRQSFDPETGSVTELTIETTFYPLSCSNHVYPTPAPSESGVPHGSGMGGALRKF